MEGHYGVFQDVMLRIHVKIPKKERQKGIDLYRPYDKPTILPGGTDMGFKKLRTGRSVIKVFCLKR
jgi:hypothetical protein